MRDFVSPSQSGRSPGRAPLLSVQALLDGWQLVKVGLIAGRCQSPPTFIAGHANQFLCAHASFAKLNQICRPLCPTIPTRIPLISAVEAVQGRRVVFDAPPQDPEANIDPDALSGLVKQVSEEWCCHIPEKKTLALFVPPNQLSSKLSREHFVDLLEYCEDELGFRKVLACFDRAQLDPKQGIPRALRCIGFSVLPPEQLPACLDRSRVFAMVYNI